MKTLRPYQIEAIDLIKAELKKGHKRVLLALATGAGKSVIARSIAEMAAEKNNQVLFTAHRTILIDQMKETFKGLSNVTCGTLQSMSRKEHNVKLVIEDESHYANGSKMRSKMPGGVITIGLSATPLNGDGSKLEGWDVIIDHIQLCDLIKMGYASPVKCLAPVKPDRENLKISKGDYDNQEAFDLMAKSSMIGDIVDTYEKYASGLRTLVFCVNIQHTELLSAEFKARGHRCDSVHSKKDSGEVLERFKKHEIDIVTNIDVLTTGFDVPDVYCIILAVPTKSIVKAVQIYGRATRLNPNDSNKTALILDCAGVIEDTIHPLTRMRFDKEKKEKKEKTCERTTSKGETCGGRFFVESKTSVPDMEGYLKVTTIKKCQKCNASKMEESLEIMKVEECLECGHIIDNVMSVSKTDKEMTFNLVCKNCNAEREYRKIELVNGELEEINPNEVTWNDVIFELKNARSRENRKYHFKWADHAIEILKRNGLMPDVVMEQIKRYNANNWSLGSLPYAMEKNAQPK